MPSELSNQAAHTALHLAELFRGSTMVLHFAELYEYVFDSILLLGFTARSHSELYGPDIVSESSKDMA